MLAYVAIGLFAGLRRSELCALEWSEIDIKARTIEVKGAKAKTRQRRIVTISDTLAEWLALAPKSAHPAPSRNEDFCSERLKNLCSERLDEGGSLIRKAIVDNWPRNALRHSFGSYHYGQYRDENRTAAEMGNSPAVVFRHYRARSANIGTIARSIRRVVISSCRQINHPLNASLFQITTLCESAPQQHSAAGGHTPRRRQTGGARHVLTSGYLREPSVQ